MNWGQQSHLPKESLITNSSVPVFTSAGDPANLFVSGNCELVRLDITNSTSATILMTITDASGRALMNFSGVGIDPTGTPWDFQLPANGIRCPGGFRIWAQSAGLFVNFDAWSHANITGVYTSV